MFAPKTGVSRLAIKRLARFTRTTGICCFRLAMIHIALTHCYMLERRYINLGFTYLPTYLLESYFT